MMVPPPLTLYIHLPWCVAKCPYCDFNSHALKGALPESAYIEALLADLDLEIDKVAGRAIEAVFFGGGTPSLFTAAAIERLLAGIRARLPVSTDAEITLEANPGTVEHDRFEAYREAGINRVSLGVQSFNDACLFALGRIHSGAAAAAAVAAVIDAGFRNFNLDLMWGLPGQTVAGMLEDLERALAFDPPHLSYYQLTIEPNTAFAHRPPLLPDEDMLWHMHLAGAERLTAGGLDHYEISAWSRPGRSCRHNLNYWRYGDYIGIGAGASGKLTFAAAGTIRRTRRHAHPKHYLAARNDRGFVAETWEVTTADRVFEYFLNRLRLSEPVALADFETRTGLDRRVLEPVLEAAAERGLLEPGDGEIRRTGAGMRYLNDLQAMFLPV